MQHKIQILDKGIVQLVDTMGSDNDILTAARISYSTNREKETTEEDDRRLMRYLMRNRHTSVFEMCEVKFYLKIPIFVARQLVRHRTANINEVSGRYSELPSEFYLPPFQELGPQSTNNKQGRASLDDETLSIIRAKKSQQNIRLSSESSHADYDRLLHNGQVSRELARIVLPLNTYTEMVWKCDLHNFFHFSKLRMDSHAQKEIRVMAQAMFDLVQPHFPYATEAFSDYILHAKTLSRLDQLLLSHVLQTQQQTIEELKPMASLIGMSDRELKEFVEWYGSLAQPVAPENTENN